MPDRSDQVPLDEVQDLVRAISLIFWLVGLDAVWTREAAASSEPATRDADRVEQLAGVVDQMDQLYGDIGALAPRLGEIFGSHATLLRERYSALVADDAQATHVAPRTRTLTADERRKRRTYVDEHGQGDIAGLATNATYRISERSDIECQNLRAEYDNINCCCCFLGRV